MYSDEKIIDGVLCWRGTPNGEWIQKTAKQLTEMLIEARIELFAVVVAGAVVVKAANVQREANRAR